MTEMQGVETTTTIDPNVIVLTHLVGDIEIPCDWDRLFHCGPRAMEEGLYCPVDCGEVFIPARKAIHFMDAL
jgi:hypothetical protein